VRCEETVRHSDSGWGELERQTFEAAEVEVGSVAQIGCCKAYVGEGPQHRLDRDAAFEARKLQPGADMRTAAAGELGNLCTREFESIGMVEARLVSTSRAEKDHYQLALAERFAAHCRVAGEDAAEEMDRRCEAQAFLNRLRDQCWVPAKRGRHVRLRG